MRFAPAILTLAFTLAAGPALAQTCIDLCAALPNCGFENGLDGWTCTQPNGNYRCQPPLGPELDAPASAVPGPDGAFVGVLNPGDGNVAGKLAHEAFEHTYVSEGTCFEIKVWGNRGRLPGVPAVFSSAPSQLTVRIFGWVDGPQPVLDPATDNWSRKPTAMSCTFAFPFPAVGSEGIWLSQIFRCTVTQHLAWVSLSLAGVNRSHDSYVAFDLTDADFVP